MAKASMPATAAAVVRREVLTVTPLCAWMGLTSWERSHNVAVGALPQDRGNHIHVVAPLSTRASVCHREKPDQSANNSLRALPWTRPDSAFWPAASYLAQRGVDDLSRFCLHFAQVFGPVERLGVDLVDVFGPARAGGEPGAVGDHLHTTDRGTVAGGLAELGGDRMPSQHIRGDCVSRQRAEGRLLRFRRHRVHPLVHRVAELSGQLGVQLARCLAGDGSDLGRQQRKDDAVLVGRPGGAVHAQKTGASAFLPTDAATRSIIVDETRVLPIAASVGQSGRCVYRYWIATARKWLGFIRPPSGVTMPWRSASASLPVRTS